jgi:DNA-binding NarL/FixJ family response regulator
MRPTTSCISPIPDHGIERLSPRERQVTRLVLDGLKPSIIARRLGLAESTVRTYLLHIQWRLKLQSRAEVAAWATAHWDWAGGETISRPPFQVTATPAQPSGGML